MTAVLPRVADLPAMWAQLCLNFAIWRQERSERDAVLVGARLFDRMHREGWSPMSVYPDKSDDRTQYTACPHCGGTDLRGPIDTPTNSVGHLTRTWFCRTCWWEAAIKLSDARAKEQVDGTTEPRSA